MVLVAPVPISAQAAGRSVGIPRLVASCGGQWWHWGNPGGAEQPLDWAGWQAFGHDDTAGASCGPFRVESGQTIVRLNAPYDFRKYSGWIVVAKLPGKPESTTPLLKT